MRVIAGKYRGRVLNDAASGNTHPMSEKMRGALFNTLGDVEGLVFLDAFSGTGTIAVEALSRGALNVTAIDNDPAAYRCIVANTKVINAGSEFFIQCANIATWIKAHASEKFDVIVADPPYTDIDPRVLTGLATMLRPQGVLAVSLPDKCPDINLPGLKVVRDKSYAGGSLRFYKSDSYQPQAQD